MQYYFNQDESSNTNLPDEGNYSGVVKSGIVQTPGADDKYIKNNNDLGSNLMNSWKIGKAIKIRALAGYSVCNLVNSDSGYNEISLPSVQKWITRATESSNSKARRFISQASMTHDNLKNHTGSWFFSISARREVNTYKNIAGLAIVDTLSEWLQNRAWGYHLSGNETFKLKKNKILIIEAGLMRENMFQEFNSLTSRFIDYFFIDPLFSLNKQKSNQILDKAWLTLKWAGKKGRINYNYGLYALFHKQFSSNDIVNENRDHKDSVIVQPRSTIVYEDSRYQVFVKIDAKLTGKSTASTGISWGFGEEKINDPGRLPFHGSALLKSWFEYRYHFSGFKSITARYQFSNSQPGPENFYGHGFLSGNATILDGASVINTTKTREASVYYVSNNIFSNSQFIVNGTLSNSSGEYNAGYYLVPAFSKTSITPTGHNYQAVLNISTEKYYSRIKSKITLLFQGSHSKRNFFINDLLNSNIIMSLRTQGKYVTAYKLPVNLEASFTVIYLGNSLSSNVRDTDKHGLWQYEGYAKLKIDFSKKLYSNLLYGFYLLSPNSEYKTLDIFSVYRYDKKWTFSVTMHNLLNDQILTQKNISSNSLNQYSFNLVGRYVLGKIGFSF